MSGGVSRRKMMLPADDDDPLVDESALVNMRNESPMGISENKAMYALASSTGRKSLPDDPANSNLQVKHHVKRPLDGLKVAKIGVSDNLRERRSPELFHPREEPIESSEVNVEVEDQTVGAAPQSTAAGMPFSPKFSKYYLV